MKKLSWLLVALAALASPAFAQSNVRPIYDATSAGGSAATPVDLSHGLPVAPVRNIRVTSAQTVTAGTYAAGNAVGGLITFTNAVRSSGGGGLLQTCILRDKAGQNVSYDLFILDATPSSTTVTDKAAVALNTADLGKVVGLVQFSSVALAAASTMGVEVTAGIGHAFKVTTGTSLFAILVTRGAPVYTSTSDVSVDCTILPD